MKSIIEYLIRQGFSCLFHLLTGLYCPGCGGTRALKYLLKGQFIKSFVYHPLILYMAVVFAAEIGSYLLEKALDRPGIYLGHEDLFTKIGIVIVLLNWIIKNIFLVVLGIDLLPV